MYVGDCSYTPRHSIYRDYERFPYGSLERNSNPQKSYYDKVQGDYEFDFYLFKFLFTHFNCID